jgi:anti-sigma factor ChrR (cupin superfamily)
VKTLLAILMCVALSAAACAQCASMPATSTKHAAKNAAAGATYWNTSQAKWIDSPAMPGLHEAVVTGDPDKSPSVIYLKLDPGTKIPLHWHTGPEILYGESGDFEVDMLKSGEKGRVAAASYLRMPGHMIHKAQCVSKEQCRFYLESPQALDWHFVDENGKEVKPAKPVGKDTK